MSNKVINKVKNEVKNEEDVSLNENGDKFSYYFDFKLNTTGKILKVGMLNINTKFCKISKDKIEQGLNLLQSSNGKFSVVFSEYIDTEDDDDGLDLF